MSSRENSREDIERSSEEILEETMKEIYDGLQDSSREDTQEEEEPDMASLQELAEELGEEGQEEEDGSGAEPFDEDDSVIRLDDNEEFYDREEDVEDSFMTDEDETEEEEKKGGSGKGRKKALTILLVILGVLVLAYLGMALFFTRHFFFYTKINGTEFSAQTVSAVESYMEGQVEDYELTLEEIDGGTESIDGDDIDLTYVDGDGVDELLKKQNPLLWITALWDHPDIEASVGVEYDKDKLSEVIAGLTCMLPEEQTAPQSARPVFQDTEFVIQDEVIGSQIDTEKFTEAVNTAISGFQSTLDMEAEGCYVMPAFTADSPEVAAARDAMNSYLGANITYDFSPYTEVVDSSVISQWVTVDDSMNVTFNQDAVRVYIQELANKYDTYGKTRTIVTSLGNTVEVSGGSYGWQIDQEAEYNALTANIQNAETVTREPQYARRAASHEGNDYGSSYVEIDLTNQHVWVYVNGQCVVETDCVTGDPTQGNGTPQGVYSLAYKQMNTTLRGPKLPDGTYEWESPVTYWMPFNGGIGLHDANWRSSFGGTIYQGNGSHGCVNLPPSVAGTVYDNIQAGTPVVCHY